MTKLSDIIGVTMTSVVSDGQDEIVFTGEDGRSWKMYHQQDCCESVSIEDICGDFDDLVGSPILEASERVNEPENIPEGHEASKYDSETWTFYIISTIRGTVTIRWYGTSNGYYSESVDFDLI